MAVDKLVDSTQLDADLTSIANAIRTKGGTSAQLAFPAGFVSAVNAIPTSSGTTLLADYTASENVSEIVLSGDFSGYLFYCLTLNGNCSRSEWIYPEFNDVSNTNYYWGGSSAWDAQIPICTSIVGTPSITAAVNKLYMSVAVGNNSYLPDIGGPFSKIKLKLYYQNSIYLSGFNVKLWGLTL